MSNEMNGSWMRLYFMPQTESANVPETLTVFLSSETANHYVTSAMVVEAEDPETFEITKTIQTRTRLFPKHYVWQLEAIDYDPVDGEDGFEYHGEGGLG